MGVKILSVRANENIRAIRIGDQAGKLSANEYLEHEIQNLFSTVAIIPKTASWNTTNADIDWEMEKSVLILFEE